jgi:hypothetical protein
VCRPITPPSPSRSVSSPPPSAARARRARDRRPAASAARDRARCPELAEAKRHVGRYRGLLGQDAMQVLARDAELLGHRHHRLADRGQARPRATAHRDAWARGLGRGEALSCSRSASPPSCPDIAVRRTASLRSAMTRASMMRRNAIRPYIKSVFDEVRHGLLGQARQRRTLESPQ